MDNSFDSDDDDFDGDDDDFDNDFDKDGDGFSDDYEELMGSDPQDPTDLPFYPPEVPTEPHPRNKKAEMLSETEEVTKPSLKLVRGSPTRNRCQLFLILFIIFMILTPFIFYFILS
jgi:hypothetical protein